jgi:acetoin:2,6-dichlorophenolindophenol oxidoreductase subunit alpha
MNAAHTGGRMPPCDSQDLDREATLSDSALLTALFRSMMRIRIAEETIAELVERNEIRCPTHLCIGQEAVAAGVGGALRRDDYVFGGHRSHGHYLAKGGDLRAFMAELFGKITGCSRGRGGSMHLFAEDVGILGTVPLVAATIPIAVGSALASKLRNDSRVSVAFFGDGATEEGHFHEAVNLAGLHRLPVIFVCENNLYASHLHISERRLKDNIFEAARAHGIPGRRLDGNDVGVVYRAAVKAIQYARDGRGPTLLECRTYRWRGHVGPAMDIDVGLKRKDELQDWLPKDPLKRARADLLARGVTEAALLEIENEAHAEIEDAVRFGRDSAYPSADDLLEHVFYQEEC